VATTVVVNVKHEECDVYIGRAMRGRRASRFQNLHHIGKDGSRAEVIERYRKDILALLRSDPSLQAELEAMRGKRIGCWCKPWACHGDILVELLEGPAVPVIEPQGCLF